MEMKVVALCMSDDGMASISDISFSMFFSETHYQY